MAGAKTFSDYSPSLEPRKLSSRSGYLCSADLDELHPHMMYGALMSSLDALVRSFWDVVPAIVSVRVMLLALLLPVVPIVLPLVVVERFFEMSTLFVVLAEAVFLIWLHQLRWRLNLVKTVDQRLPPAKAFDLFHRALRQVDQCAEWSNGRSPTEWLEGWFLKTPIREIKRNNLQEFFAWAFYIKYPAELEVSETEEIELMIKECEQRYQWSFPEGYSPGVRSMRINFDPIQAWYHPLWYYAAIRGLCLATRSAMKMMGFAQRTAGELAYFHRSAPSRPGLLVQNGKPVHQSQALPVVLLHGLGVGIMPYVRLIRLLAKSSECFVIELPEISQACCKSVLAPKEMADLLSMMLKAHGHEQAIFIAHSYGTFVMSWVLHFRKEIVARTALLDPVSLHLAQPDVAYNFLYRHPDNPMLKMVAHFVRWELFSAHVLMRHFYWHHNVLWKEELPPNSLVVLASHDDISNAHYIRRYLEDHQRQTSDNKLQLLWLEGFFHGGFLLSSAAQMQVLGLLGLL
ncbi:unnamed protein product [Effrenium voratum]|nr:unnamed protein product [Effrenium voratum]|mmetsp:Transcript_84674/g.202971  ORF Transcript_84674/g.202971 Transcript_84674/m.202971 type:complete len:515 (-) Transcript_84674:148-1692(-)